MSEEKRRGKRESIPEGERKLAARHPSFETRRDEKREEELKFTVPVESDKQSDSQTE